MRTHPLDRAFRKKLRNNSAAVPGGTWESIMVQLPAPKSKGKLLPFWLIGSALVVGIVGAILLWPKSGITEDINIAPQKLPVAQEILALTPESNNKEESILSYQSEEAENSNNENDLSDVSGISKAESSVSGSKYISAAISDKVEDQPTAIGNETHEINIASIGVADSGLETQSSSNVRTIDEHIITEHEVFFISPIAPLNSDVNYQSGIGLKVTDCYAFDKKSSGRFLLEVYTGPSFSLKSLSSKGENVDDYIAARDSTESSQLSWHAGLRVGYEHQSGITGRAGIHYTLVNEVFKLESRTVRTSIDSIFDSNGDLIRIDTIRAVGTRTKQTQNRYHTIDIPLLVGYRIDNGNWDLGVQTGPVFNIAYNAKGDMIDPATGMAGSFSDESDPSYHPVFKDKIGISIMASLYASKRIGDNLWAFVEPHFQYRLKSITLDSYPVDQKQSNIGLSIGLRLKL